MRTLSTRLLRLLLPLLAAAWLVACGGDAPELASEEATAAPTAAPTETPTAPPPTATATAAPTATSAPTPTREAVTVIDDLAYARPVGPEAQEWLADVYVPGSPGPYPAVVWAHGSNQDKSTGNILGKLLAADGYLVLSIDWQDGATSPENVRPLREAMENADCALRLAADMAAEFGGNPDQVIWAGFSAGAWLGSQMALGQGDLQVQWDAFAEAQSGPQQQVSCTAAAETPAITGFVGTSGVYPADFWYELPDDQPASELLAWARSYAAFGHNPNLRVRLIQGQNDLTAPLEQAGVFLAALEKAGYDAALFPQPGGHEPFYQVVIEQIQVLASE